jgi:hypothetical protein
MDALSEALRTIDPATLKAQLGTYAPTEAQQILAGAGVRDEHVFPTPILLETAPTLVGYYRLLLGVPQKTFYAGETGIGQFRSMETRGILTAHQRSALPQFCASMSTALAELVVQLSPTVTNRDIAELPLLTLGSQIQGGSNNIIGKKATADVFIVIAEIVRPHIVTRTERAITVENLAGRRIVIALASDPDVSLEEEVGGWRRKHVAIEIKGGTDRSNAHNRAGEAEKSHLKAKQMGFVTFWTIIATRGLDIGVLQAESPTTSDWFDIGQVLGQAGGDWDRFRSKLADDVGIPL